MPTPIPSGQGEPAKCQKWLPSSPDSSSGRPPECRNGASSAGGQNAQLRGHWALLSRADGTATGLEHQNLHDKPCRNGVACGNRFYRDFRTMLIGYMRVSTEGDRLLYELTTCARVLVHAGLPCRMAHAPSVGADPARHPRSSGVPEGREPYPVGPCRPRDRTRAAGSPAETPDWERSRYTWGNHSTIIAEIKITQHRYMGT